ncbi:uncharacterized protein LOC111113126 [Crassostrea virginica]
MKYTKDCTRINYECSAIISVQIKYDECLSDKKIPIFRCRILRRNHTYRISREERLPLEGRFPKYIETPTFTLPDDLPKRTLARFKVGEVLKLQCAGEIKSTALQSGEENFRWCKSVTSLSESENNEIISVQDDPVSSVISESKDGCNLIKRSEIFLHISNADVNLSVTCELGYASYNKNCGSGRHNGTLNIPTTADIEPKWKLSPILIYDEDNILDSREITLEGWGKTFTLLATASVRATNETKVERMQWCVKRENDTTWTRVKLQEDAIEAMENSSETITIFSKMTYHVTVLDRNIEFLVELSSSSTCNIGDYFTNISLLIKEKDNSENIRNTLCQQGTPVTLVDKDIGTINEKVWWICSVVVISLLVTMFSSIILLLILTHRRGQVALCGFIIKKERSEVISKKEVTLQSDSRLKHHQTKGTSK